MTPRSTDRRGKYIKQCICADNLLGKVPQFPQRFTDWKPLLRDIWAKRFTSNRVFPKKFFPRILFLRCGSSWTGSHVSSLPSPKRGTEHCNSMGDTGLLEMSCTTEKRGGGGVKEQQTVPHIYIGRPGNLLRQDGRMVGQSVTWAGFKPGTKNLTPNHAYLYIWHSLTDSCRAWKPSMSLVTFCEFVSGLLYFCLNTFLF